MHAFLLALSLAIWSDDLKQLGSDSFHTRETATKRLERAAPLSYMAIESGTKSKDLEIRARCRRLMETAQDRLGPLYDVQALGQAVLLLYGPPKGWELTKAQEEQVQAGGQRLNWAVQRIARLSQEFWPTAWETQPEQLVYFIEYFRQCTQAQAYGR